METLVIFEQMTQSSNWNGRNALVTGATGLLGSALTAELLRRGCRVTALVRDHDPQSELLRSGTISQVTVVQGALEDYASLERAINENECDTVFHLGAQTTAQAMCCRIPKSMP